jgi:hypothetical protein
MPLMEDPVNKSADYTSSNIFKIRAKALHPDLNKSAFSSQRKSVDSSLTRKLIIKDPNYQTGVNKMIMHMNIKKNLNAQTEGQKTLRLE